MSKLYAIVRIEYFSYKDDCSVILTGLKVFRDKSKALAYGNLCEENPKYDGVSLLQSSKKIEYDVIELEIAYNDIVIREDNN